MAITGSIELCAGKVSGCQAAIHSVQKGFKDEDPEVSLLADASNAFNSINWMSALLKISGILVHFIATIFINCYRVPIDLHIDEDVIYLSKGNIQGDPLGILMNVLATVRASNQIINHFSVANITTGPPTTGKINNLRLWWDEISLLGPRFGNHANG